MEHRLDELESRVAFQEHTLQTLNEVVVVLQREVADLRHQVKALNSQIRTLAATPTPGPSGEAPPHY